MSRQQSQMPWLDFRITEEAMNHLWDIINDNSQHGDAEAALAGNISKSKYIQDKDNWFYENVLKEMSEYVYFRESWKSYFEIVVTKRAPPPTFKLSELWVNYQKQHEFNPSHSHGGMYSFVVFMKIPTHWKEQHVLPFSANSNKPCASDFEFLVGQGSGPVRVHSHQIPLNPEDEGRVLFFPAWLKHQVYPFYGTEEERITISGNIIPQEKEEKEKGEE